MMSMSLVHETLQFIHSAALIFSGLELSSQKKLLVSFSVPSSFAALILFVW